MDVNRSIKPAATAADAFGKLSGRKMPASTAWNAVLNRATAQPNATDDGINSLHGITQRRTLENAKVSDSVFAVAQNAFSKALNEEVSKRQPLDPKQAERLKQSSETLVNQFFMGSMLKQMRSNPFKDEMFSGGKGGAAYAGLFDQHIAENAGGRIAKNLVKSMVKQYERTANNIGGGAS